MAGEREHARTSMNDRMRAFRIPFRKPPSHPIFAEKVSSPSRRCETAVRGDAAHPILIISFYHTILDVPPFRFFGDRAPRPGHPESLLRIVCRFRDCTVPPSDVNSRIRSLRTCRLRRGFIYPGRGVLDGACVGATSGIVRVSSVHARGRASSASVIVLKDREDPVVTKESTTPIRPLFCPSPLEPLPHIRSPGVKCIRTLRLDTRGGRLRARGPKNRADYAENDHGPHTLDPTCHPGSHLPDTRSGVLPGFRIPDAPRRWESHFWRKSRYTLNNTFLGPSTPAGDRGLSKVLAGDGFARLWSPVD